MLPKVPGIAKAQIPTNMNANNKRITHVNPISVNVRISLVKPIYSRVIYMLYSWI
jgi:hypothetical protein